MSAGHRRIRNRKPANHLKEGDRQRIARFLRHWIEDHGYSLAEISRRTRISERTMGRVLGEERDLTVPDLLRLYEMSLDLTLLHEVLDLEESGLTVAEDVHEPAARDALVEAGKLTGELGKVVGSITEALEDNKIDHGERDQTLVHIEGLERRAVTLKNTVKGAAQP